MASNVNPIRTLAPPSEPETRQLVRLLIDCVDGGASVGFMSPLSVETAAAYWRSVGEAVARDERRLLVAEDGGGILGTVQLVLGQPENQPHRADVSKMLVHPQARRRGWGASLMRSVEEAARRAGKSLLVLDTANPDAERLYAALGWQRCGVIPGFALMPHGGLCDTTFFYRALRP